MGELASPYLRSFVNRAKENDTTHVSLTVSASGYMHPPHPELDSRVFTEPDYPQAVVKPEIVQAVSTTLEDFLAQRLDTQGDWYQAWVSGSALSYQWGVDADPDFDVLIGVNQAVFKQQNPDFIGFNDEQLALFFNTMFKDELDPLTDDGVWLGDRKILRGSEVTFYVNPGAQDILAINPYAAYNLTHNHWTVPPIRVPPNWNPREYFPSAWWEQIDNEIERAQDIINQYNTWMNQAGSFDTENPRVVSALQQAVFWGKRASSLFADLHDSRRLSFSPDGGGYMGFYNLRWQAHKYAGTANAMYRIRASLAQTETLTDQLTTGTLIQDKDRAYMQSALFGTKHEGDVDIPDHPVTKDTEKQIKTTEKTELGKSKGV